VEGTVFWLVVVAAVELSAATTPAQFAAEGILVGLMNLILACLCWTGRKPAFLVAVGLALVTTIGAYPYPQPFRTVDTPFGALVDALVIMGSLLVVLLGLRAYREPSLQS
jgi:hypothetical protein